MVSGLLLTHPGLGACSHEEESQRDVRQVPESRCSSQGRSLQVQLLPYDYYPYGKFLTVNYYQYVATVR
jgi:hypothetical protein